MREIRIAMDRGTAELYANEAKGIQLVETMIRRADLVGKVQLHSGRPRAVGPGFDYGANPSLFAGRSGYGPLRVALDTNIAIEYFDHGARMWAGDSVLNPQDPVRGEDLEALQLILATWVLREIQFVMLRQSLSDSRGKPPSPERIARNANGWFEFYRALTHSCFYEAEGVEEAPAVSERILDHAVEKIPAGGDQRMVKAALRDGAHVYLTRDKGVLRARTRIRPLGMSILSPGELLEELSASGALNFLWDPASLYWPLPDQEKVAHLIQALQT